MTAEQEISLLNQTMKDIEEQKTLLYIKDGFEKLQLLNSRAGVDSCRIYYILQSLKDNTQAKIIAVDLPTSSKIEKLRTVLPIYKISDLVNGKAFANALALAPMETFTINKTCTFDEFIQQAVVPEYSSFYVRNKLESNLEKKPSTKQPKI